MITANLSYPKQIQVQVLAVWSQAGHTWAEIRALDCHPFTALRNGQPYASDWTVVDNARLHDQTYLFTQSAGGRISRKEKARRAEEKLLHQRLLGGSHEHIQPA